MLRFFYFQFSVKKEGGRVQTENNRKMCKHIKDKDLLPFIPPLPLPYLPAKTVPKLESSEFREIRGVRGKQKGEPKLSFIAISKIVND